MVIELDEPDMTAALFRPKLNTKSDKYVAVIQLVRYTAARVSTRYLKTLNLSLCPAEHS